LEFFQGLTDEIIKENRQLYEEIQKLEAELQEAARDFQVLYFIYYIFFLQMCTFQKMLFNYTQFIFLRHHTLS
jgi:hypothetical protein